MTILESSVSTAPRASTVLPSAEVIQLHTDKHRASIAASVFTKARVSKMRCRAGKTESFFWDSSCGGFGLRALSSGRRSWIFQYRDEHTRTRRVALGDVSAVSLDAARDAARQHAATVTKGGNPSVERRTKSSATSVLAVIEAYLSHASSHQRPRSYKETKRHLKQHATPLHHERAEAVHRRDVSELLARVATQSGPVAANRLRAALSAMWTWGLRTGLIEADSNPVTLTVRQAENPRERVLTDEEIYAIWQATSEDSDYSQILRLCLLTGCRRGEIGGLRRDEIQDGHLVIGSERMKGRVAHEVALLPMIAATIPLKHETASGCVYGRRGEGFSGWSKSKKALDSKVIKAGVQIPAWGLHDLRRTFSTRLHDAGVEPLVVEALLAHKQPGVAAVYNRASFRNAKRAALTLWHAMVKEIVEPNTVLAL
jgi:integrase